MFFEPSNTAGKVHEAFIITVITSVVLLVLVTAFMIYFLIRYNRKRNPEPQEVEENVTLEIVWTAVPTLLVLFLFFFGWTGFDFIRKPPSDTMTVNVTARQWSWTFEYENGKKSDVLRVPVGKPVKLIMTSEDVIHGFFIPAYRIKEDTVPGMKTHLWFTANDEGTYDVFCSEYCGAGHSHMLTKLIAMPADAFDGWYREAAVAKGPELLRLKGCIACHSLDGTRIVGPSFKGIYGTQVTVLTEGKERTVTVDEEYLMKSILQPQADIVKGYPPVMPPVPLTPEELNEIVAYVRTLK